MKPSAWSPKSKTGLLRGIRYGQPTAEDKFIAEADGDTIVYFATCDFSTVNDPTHWNVESDAIRLLRTVYETWPLHGIAPELEAEIKRVLGGE
jgi:hypothetical protein